MAEIFLARNATGAGVERMVVVSACCGTWRTPRTSCACSSRGAQVYGVGKLGSSYFFSME